VENYSSDWGIKRMFIKPMLADSRNEPFDDPNFIFEPKGNGIRLELVNQDKRSLFTRHATDVTFRLPEIMNLEIEAGTTLDGEAVCYDPLNPLREDFEAVKDRFNTSKQANVISAAKKQPITYIVFDILQHRGKSVMHLPILERKQILNEYVKDQPHLRKNIFVKETGIALFNTIKEYELEGMVAKFIGFGNNPDSVSGFGSGYGNGSEYQAGKRPKGKWVKIINWRYANCYIIGYRKQNTGWYLAEEREGSLVRMGFVEFGISAAQRNEFYLQAKKLFVKESKGSIWIEPVIRCRIKHRGYLRGGSAMTPVFQNFINE
jgi:DNA ligase-1